MVITLAFNLRRLRFNSQQQYNFFQKFLPIKLLQHLTMSVIKTYIELHSSIVSKEKMWRNWNGVIYWRKEKKLYVKGFMVPEQIGSKAIIATPTTLSHTQQNSTTNNINNQKYGAEDPKVIDPNKKEYTHHLFVKYIPQATHHSSRRSQLENL